MILEGCGTVFHIQGHSVYEWGVLKLDEQFTATRTEWQEEYILVTIGYLVIRLLSRVHTISSSDENGPMDCFHRLTDEAD